MKTICNGIGLGYSIKRLPDDAAREAVKQGWKYCPKSLWKERGGRGPASEPPVLPSPNPRRKHRRHNPDHFQKEA